MKKLVIISALAATSTVASAMDYKMNLEGKVDYVNSSSNTTIRSNSITTESKEGSFVAGVIRLNMVATVNENLLFRMRYRFNKAGTATGRDASNTALDYLYVDHKNTFFTTRFGKQTWSEAFGREVMISGDDLMITSDAYTNFTAISSAYRYGVSVFRNFEDVGTFTLALSNPNNELSDTAAPTVAGGATQSNTANAMGVYYNGSFMNKLIQPVLGYTLAPQDGDTDNVTATSVTVKAKNTLMAFGLRSEFAGLVADLDYKEFKKADRNGSLNTTVANKETKTKSMYANVAYTVAEFTPFVTYMNDKLSDVGTPVNDYKKNSFAVGAWFKPFTETNFRYDLHYVNVNKEFITVTSTNSKVVDHKIYFGIKADI